MMPTAKERVLLKCYELTSHYVFFHEWFRQLCLNFQIPLIKAFLNTDILIRHSITEPGNFNLFYSDIDLTLIVKSEGEVKKVLGRLAALKMIMPNIGEPEVLLESEHKNILQNETSFTKTMAKKIFQVRKLSWQMERVSRTENPYERSKLNRGLKKTLEKLSSDGRQIALEHLFPGCPESKIRLNLEYPFFSDYLQCWIEVGGCVHERSIVSPTIEKADGFLQYIPGNLYEDLSMGHVQLKKYLGHIEIGLTLTTLRIKDLPEAEKAHARAWIETLNRQLNELE